MTTELTRTHWIAIALAGALAIGTAGYMAGRSSAPAAVEGEHGEAEGEHAEEAGHGEEGFIALSAAEAKAAGVQITSVGTGGGAGLMLAGRVTFAPNAEAPIGAPLGGVVERVFVAPGSRVGAGAALATIRSGEGASFSASAAAAQAAVEAARANYDRETRLYEAKVTARQDWEAARAELARREAELRAAQAHVAAAGSPDARGRATVRTPIAGTVVSLDVAPGVVLAQGAAVARLANEDRIEIVFEAPAAVARSIRVGSTILATVANGEEVRAAVTAVAPGAEGGGFHIRARPVGFVPPAGTPLSGRIATGDQGGLSVPTDAVQTVEGGKVVFVVVRGGFRAQPVQVGRSSGDRTEILRGLTEGQQIAGSGAFLLKAELSRSEAEHEH